MCIASASQMSAFTSCPLNPDYWGREQRDHSSTGRLKSCCILEVEILGAAMSSSLWPYCNCGGYSFLRTLGGRTHFLSALSSWRPFFWTKSSYLAFGMKFSYRRFSKLKIAGLRCNLNYNWKEWHSCSELFISDFLAVFWNMVLWLR